MRGSKGLSQGRLEVRKWGKEKLNKIKPHPLSFQSGQLCFYLLYLFSFSCKTALQQRAMRLEKIWKALIEFHRAESWKTNGSSRGQSRRKARGDLGFQFLGCCAFHYTTLPRCKAGTGTSAGGVLKLPPKVTAWTVVV